MSHSQFRDLATAARYGILVTLSTGLRVIQRSKPIRHTLHLVELHLVGLMRWIINHAVAFAVEARWRFREL
jgi:hypothetical protein